MNKTVHIVYLKHVNESQKIMAVFSNWAAAENYIRLNVRKHPEFASSYIEEEWRVHDKENW